MLHCNEAVSSGKYAPVLLHRQVWTERGYLFGSTQEKLEFPRF
jgi:hypothetical protein